MNQQAIPTAAQIETFGAKLKADMPKAGETIHAAVDAALTAELLPASISVALIVAAVNLATTLAISQGGEPDAVVTVVKGMVQSLVDHAIAEVPNNIAAMKAAGVA